MSRIPIVVVKVGGSLLLWDDLPRRLQAWLNAQPAATHVLIAGLGDIGDFVRNADRNHQLGQVRSHWLCIDALSITARLLSHLLTEVPLVDSLPAARESHFRCVLDPRPFLRSEEAHAPGTRLPRHWDATTDSIAARVAECLDAQRLVLLKACDPPNANVGPASASRLSPAEDGQARSLSSFAAAEAGFIDRHFPIAARLLPRVECVNLRDSGQSVVLQRLPHDQ